MRYSEPIYPLRDHSSDVEWGNRPEVGEYCVKSGKYRDESKY